MLILDVSLLVPQGVVSGDCFRRTVGRTLDQDWWGRVQSLISQNNSLISFESLGELSSAVSIWYADTASPPSPQPKRGLAPPRVLWVLDIFCEFRSWISQYRQPCRDTAMQVISFSALGWTLWTVRYDALKYWNQTGV